MQFQVPQFIESEAKIVGPLTLKQFLFIGSGVGLSIFFFFVLDFIFFIMLSLLVLGITGSLAFVKYNGQPLPTMIKSALKFLWNPHFFVWKPGKPGSESITLPKIPHPSSPGNKIKDLVFKLNTTTKNITQRERNLRLSKTHSETDKEHYEVIRKKTGEREAARRIDYS
ncbi:MAG: hypothetical protein COU08_00945 [Candidatus Harrisonbacteria bacterium CG10_big_fil_rev_8_21_14_0_10_42_17]|uniref:PrgI family protein n=1 Tax=Candidatus Harrisonbacteria bacterium CG10_big_fil_rev_8_21_14_0_10_42_17 TaxID=1974584 RepID=A0A2M6WIX0_9BACT|nr:MAG: hypothetical protein COU08_00945 [Candidatus Harrisonbacteria bacterium CG10_big_fil_rev_8_21_14_0_10_42_17]